MTFSTDTLDAYITSTSGTLYLMRSPVYIDEWIDSLNVNVARAKLHQADGERIKRGTKGARQIRMRGHIASWDRDDVEDFRTDFEGVATDPDGFTLYLHNGATDADKSYLEDCALMSIEHTRAEVALRDGYRWPIWSADIVAGNPVWQQPSGGGSSSDLTLGPGEDLIIEGDIIQYDSGGNIIFLVSYTGSAVKTTQPILETEAPISYP